MGAKKGRVEGIERVNSYLEAKAIQIPQTRPFGVPWWEKTEVKKLEDEFRTVVVIEGSKKGGMIDDLTDALRYLCMTIDINLELVRRETVHPTRGKLLTVGRHKFYENELNPAVHPEQLYWQGLYQS